MFWGQSPALDFIDQLETSLATLPSEVNIMVIGATDCRHIIQTIAKRYRHMRMKINFFLVDTAMEDVARQLLLLRVALQPVAKLGLREKTRMFMELYGNTLIRPKVAQYLTSTAHGLVRMITDIEVMQEVMPFVGFRLQYQEKDKLETIFNYWRSTEECNVEKLWDVRKRKLLGSRYDNEYGVFDWDLHMHLHERGGSTICSQEYKHWRSTGVAFTWLDCDFSKPNRTYVSGIVANGLSFYHNGYIDDVQIGPYFSYGVSCEDEKFLEPVNNLQPYRATDITERNLLQIFYEMENEKEYVHVPFDDSQLGATGILLPNERVVDYQGPVVNRPNLSLSYEPEDITVRFVSLSKLKYLARDEAYKNSFCLLYYSNESLRYYDDDVVRDLVEESCVMIVENQLTDLDVKNSELENLGTEMLQIVPYEIISRFDCRTDFFAKFTTRIRRAGA